MSPSSAEVILLAILTVATYSLVGLLAIWAGLGKPHWFLRVAVVGGTLLLLLLIPAYEPLLLLSIQSFAVILPLMLVKVVGERFQQEGSQAGATARIRPQFSLLDLLLLTIVVAVIVAVGVDVPSDLWTFWVFAQFQLVRLTGDLSYLPFEPFSTPITPTRGWTAFGLFSLGFGISTLAAAWVALGRRCLWLRLIVLCLVPTSAVMAGWLALMRASEWLAAGTHRADSSATARPGSRATRPTFTRLARLSVALLSLSIVVPPLVVFCVLVAPAPDPPKVVLPDPNGYDDLVNAGELFGPAGVTELDTATLQQLQGFVGRYAHAFDMARVGLARECRMPPVYSTAELGESLDDVEALRDLVLAFRAEGKLAELEGRPADAAESYLDVIRLGLATARGSRALHWTVSHAWESTGIDALIRLRETLPPEQCRELIDTLQTMNANREPLQDVAARERLSERIGFQWYEQLVQGLSTITGSKQDLRSRLEDITNQQQAKFRLLICGLALRAYCVENGQPPKKLADLVPDYLPEVPPDPFSGQPLVYRRDAKGYVLYSVGPDGQDDGGQLHGYSDPGTDILLDKPPEGQQE